MHKSKLIQIMSTLNSNEMGRFDKYVHSPFFTVHQDTIKLFEIIKGTYPAFTESEMLPEIIYAKIYPNTPFNDAKLRTLRKYLLKLLLGFLAYIESEKNDWNEETHQLEALLNRNLDKHFSKQLEEAEKKLQKASKGNFDYFLHQYRILGLKVNYQFTYEGRFTPKDQEAVLKAIDNFYLSTKLNYFNSVISIQKFSDSKDVKDIPMYHEVMNYCEQHLDELPLITKAYYHSLLLRYPDDTHTHYFKLLEMCPEFFADFNNIDLGNICNIMINYCNTQFQRGKAEFQVEMFKLYKKMLSNDVLFDEAMLSSHHYKNITTIGLRLGEFGWTEKFIEDHKERIELQYREGVYNYNLAHLYAYKKEYDKSLKHLQQVEFIDPFYKISYDSLLLRIYYECEEVEAFLALCTSFQTFIRRKKALSTDRKNAYLNFIKYAKALFNIKMNAKKNFTRIRKAITECDTLMEKNWILEKMEELATVGPTK